MAGGSTKWLKWSFVAENVVKGMLQAVGGLLIYVGVIVYLVYFAINSTTLRDAVALRMPGLAGVSGGGGGGGGVVSPSDPSGSPATALVPASALVPATAQSRSQQQQQQAATRGGGAGADATAAAYLPYEPVALATVVGA